MGHALSPHRKRLWTSPCTSNETPDVQWNRVLHASKGHALRLPSQCQVMDTNVAIGQQEERSESQHT